MKNMTKLFALVMALCMALGMVPAMAEETAAAPTAFLMYADGAWVNQVWNPGETPEGVKVTEAAVTGEGDYTVGLEFATPAEGLAFAALGISDGEKAFPNWSIKINEIRVNGEAIEVKKGYTSSDDQVVTRMNIYNEWVAELPADAHSYDGTTDDASWMIVDKEAFASVSSVEVDFSFYRYGVDTAYIMFADGGWAKQYWLDGNTYEGVTAKNATITGPGDYTVGLEFAEAAEGVSFTALGVKHGEKLFPGMMLKINEIRINGTAIEAGKGYTSSDDQLETRMNIMNEWVSELPADARSFDGTTEGANWIIVDKAAFTGVTSYEIDFTLVPVTDTAYIMFADGAWANQAWNPGEYAETNAVKVEGPGTYTVKFDCAEPLADIAFMALGVATGEKTFPGYYIDITDIKVNGESVELGKGYTSSDDQVVTRENIMNEWVTELPEDAHRADGNLEGASAIMVAKELLTNISSLEVTFDYIYGKPVVKEDTGMTEEEITAALAADYAAYVAVQSETYIFRNDWDDASYGLNGESADFFTHLTGWDADGNAVNYGGSFEDAAITGNGTYTVKMTTGDMGFGTDTYFHFFRVATSIPSALVADGHVQITDATVKIGDSKTQEGLVLDTSGDYAKIVVTDEYNKLDAGFGYNLPGANTEVVFTFTVSGLAD